MTALSGGVPPALREDEVQEPPDGGAPSAPTGRWAMPFPTWDPPVRGETSRQASDRRQRNRDARDEWDRWVTARCAECGMTRLHVSHETDPDTSPEGPEYHASFAHHPFAEPVR